MPIDPSDPNTLVVVTIYHRPSDYPEHYVVRNSRIPMGGELIVDQQAELHGSLAEARRAIHKRWQGGCIRVQGVGDDPDPVIAEVYI